MPTDSSSSTATSATPYERALSMVSEIRRRIDQGTGAKTFVNELKDRSVRPGAIAALAYATWKIEGELVAHRNGDRSVQDPAALADQRRVIEMALSYLEQISIKEVERRSRAVALPSSAPNHLSAIVMQHLGGIAFQKDLRNLLREDGLAEDAVHPPNNAGFAWARGAGLLPAPNAVVESMLECTDEAFVAAMLKDSAKPGFLPDHPLIAERRLALDRAAKRQARLRNGKVEERISRIHRAQRTRKHFQSLRQAYEQAGGLALRQKQSEVMLAESRLATLKLRRSTAFLRLRADYLQRAAELAAQRDPALWQTVLGAVIAHQRHCPEVRKPFPCSGCAPELAAAVKKAGVTEGESYSHDVHPAAVGTSPVVELQAPEALAVGVEAVASSDAETRPRDDALLIAVAASSNDRSSAVGLAWISGDGQSGAATDHAGSQQEAQLMALGRAVADQHDTDVLLDLVVADDRTRQVAMRLIQQPRGQAPAVTTELDSSRELLACLIGQEDRVRVLSRDAAKSHPQLVREVAHLAKFALDSIRGGRTRRDLQREMEAIADRLAAGEAARSVAPHKQGEYLSVRTQPDVKHERGGIAEQPRASEVVRFASPYERAAEPRVRSRDGGLTWRQGLRAGHLVGGTFPVPTVIQDDLRKLRPGSGLRLTLVHRSPTCPGDKRMLQLRATSDNEVLRLDSASWPKDFFPGIYIECTWRPRKQSFMAKTFRLASPSRIGDRTVGYEYDPIVYTRETAPGGADPRPHRELNVEDWVLRTMQILGYLDANGRAVLAEDALEQNLLQLGFPPKQLGRVIDAVARLVLEGRLQRVQGSLQHDGRPTYPPIPRLPAVDLLSFQPKVVELPREMRHPKQPLLVERKAHYVSGFVRRLPAGATASDEARGAHTEAQRQAHIANDGPLKPGYTFVRKHRRRS